MAIITTALLFRHEQFNSTTLLRSLGYSVALSVRQAQLYGIAVREFAVPGEGKIQSYGVSFLSADPTTYRLFADANLNGRWDDGETVREFTMRGGFHLNKICAYIGGTPICSGSSELSTLAIVFRRPNLDACFSSNTSSGQNACNPNSISYGSVYQRACIELASPGGNVRSIIITNTGQISVGWANVTCGSP